MIRHQKDMILLLSKHRSLFHVLISRCFSSNQATLSERLKVTEVSTDVFMQPADVLNLYPNRKSVFGGQIVGTAVHAAQQTVDNAHPLHSLHAYFLSAANDSSAITYTVSRLSVGKSFQTRNVTARQAGKILFEGAMSFHRKEKGNMEHQLSMPQTGVVPPEELFSLSDYYQKLLDDKRLTPEMKTVISRIIEKPLCMDIRYCFQRDILEPELLWPARQFVWIKSMDTLPDDPRIHRAAVAYCSDRILLDAAFLPYALNGANPRLKMRASLDHSMWFHDDFCADETDQNEQSNLISRSANIPAIPDKETVRADDWLLYELECPVQLHNRAWTTGRIWTRNGRLIASCTQEGVVRCE